jgi:hypothetical protein
MLYMSCICFASGKAIEYDNTDTTSFTSTSMTSFNSHPIVLTAAEPTLHHTGLISY